MASRRALVSRKPADDRSDGPLSRIAVIQPRVPRVDPSYHARAIERSGDECPPEGQLSQTLRPLTGVTAWEQAVGELSDEAAPPRRSAIQVAGGRLHVRDRIDTPCKGAERQMNARSEPTHAQGTGFARETAGRAWVAALALAALVVAACGGRTNYTPEIAGVWSLKRAEQVGPFGGSWRMGPSTPST